MIKPTPAMVHQLFQEMAQHIWDEYKVLIKNVSIDWTDLSTHSGREFRVEAVATESSHGMSAGAG